MTPVVNLALVVSLRCPRLTDAGTKCRAVVASLPNPEAATIFKALSAQLTCPNRRCNARLMASSLDMLDSSQ